MNRLNENELFQIFGGTDPDGCAGCTAGTWLREQLIEIWNTMGKSGHIGMPGNVN